MNKSSAPTMKDVAREAGVALGTVSKVINGLPVGTSYKIKVDDAIKKLNYQVNTYARGLKTSQTKTLTLIIPSLTVSFYATLAYEIEQQAYLNGRKLILCCSNGIPEKEIEYLSLATQSKTDGIIALTYSDISKQVPEQIPLIAFDRYFENHTIARISSDNYSGGFLAVEKLSSFGCKKILFIGFHSQFSGEADKRFSGYLDACKKFNIQPDYLFEPDRDDMENCIRDFIRKHEDSSQHKLDFDGIFANTDYYACVIIHILLEFDYKIPDDVQIIGFDGIKKLYPEDAYVVSTICQPLPAIAKNCIEMILHAETTPIPSLTLLPVSYQYGGTTKK